MLRWLLAFLVFLTAPAQAADSDSAAIEEVRAVWTACTEHLGKHSDDWIGWRRDLGGGYGDTFEFWDNDGDLPSILKRIYYTDAIVMETQTFCFRTDDSLAFVYIKMTSPNGAEGSDGAIVTRQGRIYVDPAGRIIRKVVKVVGSDGETPLNADTYLFARGCRTLDLHLTLESVRTNYDSELNDGDSSEPAYTPNPYDWCSAGD
jgi:hypothetical protein